jgi:hypothetical protein
VRTFVAPAVGYVIGAKSAGEEGKHLARSLEALRKSDESAGVVAAARSQMANSPRGLAARVDGARGLPDTAASSSPRYAVSSARFDGRRRGRPGPPARPGPARWSVSFRTCPRVSSTTRTCGRARSTTT